MSTREQRARLIVASAAATKIAEAARLLGAAEMDLAALVGQGVNPVIEAAKTARTVAREAHAIMVATIEAMP